MTSQWSPERLAGQPETDAARLVLLDRLLAERFPGMHRRVPPRLTPVEEPWVVPVSAHLRLVPTTHRSTA